MAGSTSFLSFPCSDEVVVHDEDAAAPAPPVELVELSYDLCRVLGRGARPKSTVMSQKSQSKGQPREYWMFMDA